RAELRALRRRYADGMISEECIVETRDQGLGDRRLLRRALLAVPDPQRAGHAERLDESVFEAQADHQVMHIIEPGSEVVAFLPEAPEAERYVPEVLEADELRRRGRPRQQRCLERGRALPRQRPGMLDIFGAGAGLRVRLLDPRMH